MAGARDGQLRIRRGEDSPPWGLDLYDDTAGRWRDVAFALGVPVLRGPYVVDYTDIPHDGDRLALWTPEVGDILLRLFMELRVPWDHGTLLIGGADARTDTMMRPDQIGWGIASDGHTWSKVYDGGASDGIASGRATISTGPTDDTSNWLLEPALSVDDAEILVRWRQDAGELSDDLTIHTRADDTDSAHVELQVQLDGTIICYAGGSSSSVSWPGAALGQDVWARMRAVGSTISYRAWIDGTTEPDVWAGTTTQTGAIAGRHCGLSLGTSGPHAATMAIGLFRATSLMPCPVADSVLHSADPVQLQLIQTGDTDPTTGLVHMYAEVARAVAP